MTDDMSLRDWRELRLVLLPAYGIMLIALSALPSSAALIVFGQRNVGPLFLATAVGCMLAYEWLHLSYHLPKGHPLGKSRAIRWMCWHHALHHNPARMQKWNFNVNPPLFDWILGTWYREAQPPREP